MDLDAIKSRLNQLQNTQTNAFWKPQPGKSQIRIVPYKFDKNNPFSELFFHILSIHRVIENEASAINIAAA